jgi:hypothetical protein
MRRRSSRFSPTSIYELRPEMTRQGRRITAKDLADLTIAVNCLENPGVAAKIADLVGSPIEVILFKKSPRFISKAIGAATTKALKAAMRVAIGTVGSSAKQKPSRNIAHKMAVATTGAAGGFFGLLGIGVELPVTTTIMLRSIADIARSEGEDLDDPATKLACMEVFAIGGKSGADDDAEAGYLVVRAAMAQQVASAAEFIAAHGIASEAAPVLVSVINSIASRFSVAVSEKVIAQAAPIVGAASGALLNTLFMNHFQSAARGHFIVRRLERKYGQLLVQLKYKQLSGKLRETRSLTR